MGNKKNMKTMNTLLLIVTLTIFLANGSMSKNLNRKPTINAPFHPAPGFNGTGINPNWKTSVDIKPMEFLPAPENMPGFNGTGINPNSKPSMRIEQDMYEHKGLPPGANGTGINPNYMKPHLEIEPMGPSPAIPTKHAMPGENGTGINPNSKPTLKIEPMGPAPAMPRKHAMPGFNGTGINPNLKISTDIKPMAPVMPVKHAMPVPAVNGIPFGAHAPGFNRTGINPNPKIAFKEAMETPPHMFEGDTAELPVNKTISNDEDPAAEEVVSDNAPEEVNAPEEKEQV